MNRLNAFDSVLDVVGNTPLVRINRLLKEEADRTDTEVFAKLEFLNPMGSVKDRIARYMVEKAEEEGLLKNGQLIIENSSGNTALGLAMVAIQKGYKLKVVVRDTISPEKADQLSALGVDIVKADTSLHPHIRKVIITWHQKLLKILPEYISLTSIIVKIIWKLTIKPPALKSGPRWRVR